MGRQTTQRGVVGGAEGAGGFALPPEPNPSPWTSTGVSKGVVMRVPGGPSIWKTRLWRLWCGGRWGTDAILIFSMCSTTLVFPVEHFGPVLRGDFGSPSAPWAQNFLKAPLCGAEALRALRAPNRPGLTAAHQPPAGPNSSAHSSRARSANRVGASATQWAGEVQPNHCRA